MKRRSFIGMLGAAVTAPALPMAAPSLSPKISALVAAHVRKYPVITVLGISNRIGIPQAQAEEVLYDLARQGLVGPVTPGPHGPVRAKSTLFKPTPPDVQLAEVEKRMKAQRAQIRERKLQEARERISGEAVDWLHYLQKLCVKHEFSLQPRALGLAA